MKISTLQSQVALNSRTICLVECRISNKQGAITFHRVLGSHKDCYAHKYREISRLKKTLKKLVSLQRELRNEISDLVAHQRFVKEATKLLKRHAERANGG